MSDEHEDEPETVRCPKCNAKVRVDDKAKKTHVATCPNGHEVELVKMIE
jgi:hypothetical protein